MSMEAAALRKKAVQAQDDAKSEIERFQQLLQRMYRDSIREMKDRIFNDILEGMNDSTRELVRAANLNMTQVRTPLETRWTCTHIFSPPLELPSSQPALKDC